VGRIERQETLDFPPKLHFLVQVDALFKVHDVCSSSA